MKHRALICASGNLGYSVLKKICHNFDVVGILTDSQSTKIIDFAIENGIKVFSKNPRKHSDELAGDFFPRASFLISVNFLYLIDSHLIEKPEIAALNIHGALLPRYRGRAPHIWAIINGETECGITVHKIDLGCDTGDIILQKKIAITEETTGGQLLQVFEEEYPQMILEAVDRVINRHPVEKQDESKASYFGKRTPEDGEIDWSLSSVDIKNWVRALTRPYPGAFTFIDDKKLFVWKVEDVTDCEMLFEGQTAGAAIVKDPYIYVKTANGVLKITDYSCEIKPKGGISWRFRGKCYGK